MSSADKPDNSNRPLPTLASSMLYFAQEVVEGPCRVELDYHSRIEAHYAYFGAFAASDDGNLRCAGARCLLLPTHCIQALYRCLSPSKSALYGGFRACHQCSTLEKLLGTRDSRAMELSSLLGVVRGRPHACPYLEETT